MFQINCLNPISKVGLQNLTADYQMTDNVNDAEGILVRSASMHEMELSDKLLAVARAGAGVNNIPLEKCAEKGIVVYNTPGANANGVKELVIAGMLLGARDILGSIQWVRITRMMLILQRLLRRRRAHMQEMKSKARSLVLSALVLSVPRLQTQQ